MRIVNTFSSKGYKVTLFTTDDRYLLQIEDNLSIISWKISKEVNSDAIETKFLEELTTFAEASKKNMIEHMKNAIDRDRKESLPNII